MPGLIDIHAHFLTKNYLAAMRATGMDTVDGFPLPDWSPDTALALMDRCGIETQILSISAPGIDFVSGEAARRLARDINEELAGIVARHPGRFRGFGLLPLPDLDGALQELAYALDVLKFDGLGLYTNFGGLYPGDSRLDPLFEELNRRKAVVYVHPVAPPDFDMTRFGFPAPTIEYPFDTTRMILNLVSSGTLRRFPDVRMIVSHGGGTLPFLVPRMMRHMVRFARSPVTPDEIMADFRSLYFDMTAVSHPHAIDALLTLAPKDHLLYGSDHPFMVPTAIPQGIEFLATSPKFDEVTRRAVSYENARALFPQLAKG
ncbi:amidohydrolase family protein [Pseudorhodoplanes sp.]|uniref:amidohydrolase family protein n=1 Tax=Pseudorhodoplanes sp. TaxID=1934341 RepID=UPI002BF7A6AD|nr:amidohydrolase family protein [Pseudorhodoplanes sp.]HWV53723.1 amidohydrolase family protein [Pseudorhodoplanes sp.]